MKRFYCITIACIMLISSCTKVDSPKKNIPSSKNHNIFLDADTGNEIDDLYAIVRALVEPAFNVRALSSAQYHSQNLAPENTVIISQQLNEEILELMNLDIPHPMGANDPLADLNTPQSSPAALMMIDVAHSLKDGEMLDVVVLGAMTNVASAILIDPSIVKKIRVHVMAMLYDAESGVWNKNEFNTNNDKHAMDVLLNTTGLDLQVMTATASRSLMYYKDKVDNQLKGKAGIWDYLVDRWEHYLKVKTWSAPTANEEKWIMWDIAIIEALVNPDFAERQNVLTPPENVQRQIQVYTKIDAAAMQTDYWQTFEKIIQPQQKL